MVTKYNQIETSKQANHLYKQLPALMGYPGSTKQHQFDLHFQQE